MSYEYALKIEKWTNNEFCQNCTEKKHCKLKRSECPLWKEYKAVKSQKAESKYHKWSPEEDRQILKLSETFNSKQIADIMRKDPKKIEYRKRYLRGIAYKTGELEKPKIKNLKQHDNLIAEFWNQGMTVREIAEKLNIENPTSINYRLEILKRKGKAERKYR
jgi:hypothetical protein